jgi:cell division protein ZapB
MNDVAVRMTDATHATNVTKSPLDLELKRLEKRVDELVALNRQLQEENRALRVRHDTLTTERASLLHRNEQVRTRVEAMIGRLKTLEHGT